MRFLAALVVVTTPVWTAVNLGPPPGHPNAYVQGVLVNASGMAVAIGGENTPSNPQQAFVWQKGKKTALAYRSSHEIDPDAIDRAGDVVGTAGTTAVLWRKGTPTALGRFGPNGINDNGTVVVGSTTVNGNPHAFVWQNGTLTDLPGLGGTESEADAANNNGTVVGESELRSGVDHAVAWQKGVPTDLGSVNGLDSTATLVTNDGTILGFASTQDGSDRIALEWKNDHMIVLGRFGAGGAQPVAVNARGDILIQTMTANQGIVGLFLFTPLKTTQISTPALGHQGLQAVGLDNDDNVVGYGAKTLRGFLWRHGLVTRLPPGFQPRALAGSWIIGSNGAGAAVLLHVRD